LLNATEAGPMIEHILKAIGIAGMVVICAGFAFVLAYSMVTTWLDTPLLSLPVWGVIGLITVLLGWQKKKRNT